MDEGRLAVVFRQEEQHRKFVYMMNDIVRARLSLYTNCLSREQHESSIKLLKNCSEMRKSVVRQKVLRKCLEMRKRQILDQDPTKPYGQYGGKPLWAMSRDIDHVIASNHPTIRRMKRVKDVMQQSLETGAILDEEAVSRRIEAFFQLKQVQKQKKQQQEKSPERAQEIFKGPVQRRNVIKPPSWVVESSANVPQTSLPSDSAQATSSTGVSGLPKHAVDIVRKENARKEKRSETNTRPRKESSDRETSHLDALRVVNNVSLDVDSKGRLRGIKTNKSNEGAEVEQGKPKNMSSGSRTDYGRSPTGIRGSHQAEILTIRHDDGSEGERGKKEDRGNSQDAAAVSPRSKLILPPIESSKALVSRR